MQIPVTGMSCQGCAQSIQEAISKLPGARDVHVNFALKQLSYEGVSLDEVFNALHSLGYDSPGPVKGIFKVPDIEKMAALETRAARIEFLVAAFLGIPEFFFGMNWFWWPVPAWVQCGLVVFVVFGAGFGLHRRALKQILKSQVTMDTLVSMGSMAALLESCILWFRGSSNLGFEAASTIVLFILLGKYLEARGRRGTFSATAELFKTFQQSIIRITNGVEEKISSLDIRVGDKILLRPGEICPADGIIIDGAGQLDESSLTGEPMPRQAAVGSSILSGGVLLDSPLTFLVEKAGAECFMGRLLLELEKAEDQPVKLQRLADRVTAYFVPGVILTAALAALAQFFIKDNPELAFNVFLSVLLVACPCALGLAIPTALVAGLGASARRGVLFRDASVLETSALIKDLYFDKTGTLTEGKPKLAKLELLAGLPENEILELVTAVEKHSTHPLAKAFLNNRNATVSNALHVKMIPGIGIEGQVQGRHVRIARVNSSNSTHGDGMSSSDIFVNEKLVARAFFTDDLRSDSLKILKSLRALNFRLHLLTGDNEGTVKQLKLEEFFDSIKTNLLPQDKKRIIEEARQKAPSEVAFIGDGVNDVLALSVATVGFAVASGAPAALGAGSVSLSRGIKDLPLAFVMAWKTQRQLKFNLFWAMAYNGVMLPWAISGTIAPMWAALAMSASSVTVVMGSVFLSYRLRKLTVC